MKITDDRRSVIHNMVYNYGNYIINSQNFQLEKNYLHHAYSTAYQHSIHVAEISLELIYLFSIKHISIESVIKAALLHDYYLYNWHDKTEKWHKPHAFKHPKIAEANAKRDFGLTKIESDAIKKHMWPLTFLPPLHKEGWIITFADKIATFREKFRDELIY